MNLLPSSNHRPEDVPESALSGWSKMTNYESKHPTHTHSIQLPPPSDWLNSPHCVPIHKTRASSFEMSRILSIPDNYSKNTAIYPSSNDLKPPCLVYKSPELGANRLPIENNILPSGTCWTHHYENIHHYAPAADAYSLPPSSPRSLKRTRESISPPIPETKFKCSFTGCRRKFTSRQVFTQKHSFFRELLEKHQKIHTKDRPFACPIPNCVSRFSRRDNMMQHYKNHAARLEQQQQS